MQKELSAVCEEDLIASAKSGDELAFEALADTYKKVVEYHIKSLVTNPSDHDDLFQEGLVGLLKAVRSYDASKTASFATFASLCVKNSIISGVRKNATQTSKTVIVPKTVEDGETSPSAEEILIDKVRAKLLYDKVYETLSAYEKTVFDMYLSDMSYESIAFVTGKSVKSTSNAIFRIRNKLKQMIGNADSAVPH